MHTALQVNKTEALTTVLDLGTLLLFLPCFLRLCYQMLPLMDSMMRLLLVMLFLQ